MIYWSSIVLAMAVLTGVLFFWAAYLWRDGSPAAAALFVPLAIALALAGARFGHWYCRVDSYESLTAAMTDISRGGFALFGAFAGCLAAALLLWGIRVVRRLPPLLDALSLAGAAAIAVGRLASFFNASDRGQILASLRGFPWASPVLNTVSGSLEFRLATFALQAMAAGIIFLLLAGVFLFAQDRFRLASGEVTLLFLLLYGGSQVVLDSTRYDSLYLRSNGFVSIVQILGAVGFVAPMVIWSVRLVKAGGWKKWYPAVWAALLGLIGCAGYMEYHVQRHGNQAVFAYSVMCACLIAAALLAILLWLLTVRRERLRQLPTNYPS